MGEELVERVWGLSDLMCQVAGVQIFSTVLVADEYPHVLAIKKGWAGGEPEGKSCASFVGPLKAAELLFDLSEPFATTPTGHPLGCGWMGGVRQFADPFHHVTSGSAWSERCDAQHALVLNYALRQETRLHHVGFRYPTHEAMMEAVEADQQKFGVEAVAVPASDHQRFYVPVKTDLSPNGVVWREHQFFPEGQKSWAVHWDLATYTPLELLAFIAKGLKAESELKTWEAGPNDPMGVIWQMNRDGAFFGIMARSHWWVPGE